MIELLEMIFCLGSAYNPCVFMRMRNATVTEIPSLLLIAAYLRVFKWPFISV